MSDPTLHVVTMVSNPIRWESRTKLARAAILGWLQEPNVHVTLVEVAHGSRDYDLADLGSHPQVTHIPLHQTTMAWCKESAMNVGISRLPRDAKYVGTFDADIHFRKSGWASETLHALQLYPVVQPWKTCYDLGPDDDHVQVHKSFASQWHKGEPVIAKTAKWWNFGGAKPGPYTYPHCLTAETLIVPGGKVLAASSRPFKGNLVVIRTSSGKELSCTPNHPILTDAGWVRADKFKVGDNVFRYLRQDRILGHVNKDDVPVRIEDIVRSFSERPGMGRTAVHLPDDLDNNGADCKVADVWSDRLLSDKNDSSLSQESGNLSLRDIGMKTELLDRSGATALFIKGLDLTSSPDETALSPALFAKLGRQFVDHSFANRPPYLDSSFWGGATPGHSLFDAPLDGSSSSVFLSNLLRNAVADDLSSVPLVHADDLGAFRGALAGKVEADEVVYVGRREFDGQVYDLQTENGYMLGDEVLCHNSGFLWGWVLEILEKIGGLFEHGAMGSGDHHQALSLIGAADYSLTRGIGTEYRNLVKTWEGRALAHVNKKIGFVPNTIEHYFHGDKSKRQYVDRWQMFLRHSFNPHTDLKRNRDGLIEFSGNKPALELEFDNYLRNRREDDNCIG